MAWLQRWLFRQFGGMWHFLCQRRQTRFPACARGIGEQIQDESWKVDAYGGNVQHLVGQMKEKRQGKMALPFEITGKPPWQVDDGD